MKALTIRQPWASLIAAGVKTIETRSWATSFRGPLAIHAGKRWDVGWGTHALWHDPDHPSTARDRSDILVDKLRCNPMEDCNGSGYWTVDAYDRRHIPLGAVVATCTLADVVPMIELADEAPGSGGFVYVDPDFIQVHDDTDDSTPRYLEAERHLGIYGSGRYAFLLTDIAPCDPVPAKGRQGLWDWDGTP